MKKCLIAILALTVMQFAYAVDTANIKIKVNGAIHDNTYFLCLPNVGCLSIMAAKKGKVYPIINSFEMRNLYVTNQDTFELHHQGLPESCKVTVKTNQTITISGTLVEGKGENKKKVAINNLRCSIS